jgi:hypothetical protein
LRAGLLSQERKKTERATIEAIVEENPTGSETDLVKKARSAGIAKHRTEMLLASGVNEGWLEVEVGARGRKTYRRKEAELGML